MRNADIVASYLRKMDYKLYKGNRDNCSPFTHYFLMDASKSFFDRLPDKTGKGLAKKYLSETREGYHLFFRRVHEGFTVDELDFLLCKVDDYENFLAPHYKIAEIAYQELDNDRPFAEQKLESDIWMANLLARDAQDMFGEVWKTGRLSPMKDRYIEQVIHGTKELARTIVGDRKEVATEAQFNRVQDAVKIIANKTMDWLVNDYCADTGQSREDVEEKAREKRMKPTQ